MYTKKPVLVEDEEIIGCTCDVCGKVIFPVAEKKECFSGYHISTEWYNITTGHCDWGVDSMDSIERKEVCSIECAKKIIDEYCRRSWGNVDTEYIEIEHAQR